MDSKMQAMEDSSIQPCMSGLKENNDGEVAELWICNIG